MPADVGLSLWHPSVAAGGGTQETRSGPPLELRGGPAGLPTPSLVPEQPPVSRSPNASVKGCLFVRAGHVRGIAYLHT